MMMKKFVADSYYEAFLKAQSELGSEMIVITSRTFPQSSWAGLYKQEMVEITAAVPRSAPGKPQKAAPTRPEPTEEILPPPQPVAPSQSKPSPEAILPPHPVSKPTPQEYGPSLRPQRFTQARVQSMRPVHGLRSNQEGEAAPQSQRFQDDAKNAQRIQALLGDILSQRAKGPKKSESEVSPPPPPPPPPAFDAPVDRASIQALEARMAEILDMVKKMQEFSGKALATPNPSVPEGLFHLRKLFSGIELPAEILEGLLEILGRSLPPQVLKNPAETEEGTARWLREHLRFSPPIEFHPQSTGPKIFILIGPTGVGKTTTIAKLAASFALDLEERKKVALFTLDTFRIGAPAQLMQYAQIIEAEMEIIFEPDDIPQVLQRHISKDVILVDTAGRCQKNVCDLDELKRFLKYFPGASKYLVLSATTKFSDLWESIRKFGEIGFDELIFTKIDETNSIGPLLGVLLQSKLPLAFLTHGQSVPDDFKPADPGFFLGRIFPKT